MGWNRFSIQVALLVCLFAGAAHGSTYYIAASGSDSNNGTTTSTPWAHAPGMPNCTGTCNSTTLHAGDFVYFRGGDTWHFKNSSASPYVGGTWTIPAAGSAGTCNLNALSGAITKGTCLYVGTLNTFFTGGSFTRPIFTMDSPASTSLVASCTYDVHNFNGVFLHAYTILDDIEFTGNCISATTGADNSAWVTYEGDQVELSNSYYHGWTLSTSATQDNYSFTNYASGGGWWLVDHNVIDGADSTYGTTAYKGTGKIFSGGREFAFNIVRHVNNVEVGDWTSAHDNLFEYCYNDDGLDSHGNILESNGTHQGNSHLYFYNNVYRHSDEGVGIYGEPQPGYGWYIFGNIIYDTANAVNCVLIGLPQTPGSGLSVFFWNNTLDYQANVQGNTNGGCAVKLAPGGSTTSPTSGNTIQFSNNHFINFSPANLPGVYFYVSPANSSNFAVSDPNASSEIFQTEAVANGQGYQASNMYQPTLPTNATVTGPPGFNNTSNCATFSSGSQLCSGSSAGVTEVAGQGGYVVSYPAISINARPTSLAWNSGAYQLPSVTLSPSSQNFGSVNVGFTGTPTTFTLTNSSGATVTGISAGFVGGNSGDWTNTGAGTCGSTLANGSSCTFIVEFVPTVTGARSTTLTVTDSAINSPQTSALTGTGSTAGSVTVSPTSNNFGSVTVGSTSAAATFTLSNTTGVSLTGITVSFTGTNASDFAQSGGSCGSTLASGSTCTILATFTPAATGARSGALNIADSDPSSPQTSTFIGTGVSAGSVTVTPGTQNFGSINLGSASSPVTFTLSNTTPSGLTGIAITLTGTNSADFAQTGGTCSTTLGASSTCTIILTFTPSAAGTRTATLNVADSATSSPQQSALVGNGNTITPLPGPCPVCFE